MPGTAAVKIRIAIVISILGTLLFFGVLLLVVLRVAPQGIAGLIAAVALISQYLANGIEWTNTRLKTDMHKVIAMGLLVAVVTGLVSIGLGYPFLTSAFTYLNWPVVGQFEIASAIAFDVGVFLVVVGVTVMILVELGKLSYNAHVVTAKEPRKWNG